MVNSNFYTAIEFNGDYWHDENHKQEDYHYNKFTICKDTGILLVSIFESEWNSNNESIKSYLYDIFNGNSNSLSYIDDVTMNNNFPDVSKLLVNCEHIDHFYETGRFRVYTCGFSKLV